MNSLLWWYFRREFILYIILISILELFNNQCKFFSISRVKKAAKLDNFTYFHTILVPRVLKQRDKYETYYLELIPKTRSRVIYRWKLAMCLLRNWGFISSEADALTILVSIIDDVRQNSRYWCHRIMGRKMWKMK